MSDLVEKCMVCGALVDEEDLFCANCGTEAARGGQPVVANATRTSAHSFGCQGCGASMGYDASAGTLRCPFCGGEKLQSLGEHKTLAPERAIALRIGRDQADQILRDWLGASFWRPRDLAATAAIQKMTAVHVPYWVFEAQTFTYWTADSSQTPMGASGDWVPMSGSHRGSYRGLLVGASSVLTTAETDALCPFDLSQAEPVDQVSVESSVTEEFQVPRKYARPKAREGLENLEREACSKYVPGRARNVKVNVRLHDLSSEPVIVPVWVMAYTYRDKLYRFLINGQTGRCTGEAPTSVWKIVLIVLGVIGLLLLILMIIGLISQNS